MTTVKCRATLFIRQRKNSLFYKSTHSAYIASVLTSLIATCLYAGVNAVEYLAALQEYRGEVFAEYEDGQKVVAELITAATSPACPEIAPRSKIQWAVASRPSIGAGSCTGRENCRNTV